MNITLYTSFSKRKNSTKTPTGGTVVSNVELKKPTSIHEPIFVLGPVTGVTMENVTYVKAFNHYYFVNDITVTPHDYFEISCSEDPMASNKSAILASTQYVLYSASQYNAYIPDSRLIIEATKIPPITKYFTDSTLGDSDGSYIVSCISDVAGNEFITHYAMTKAQITSLGEYLFDSSVTDWNDVVNGIDKFIGKPFDAIISIIWLPINIQDAGGSSTSTNQITLGEVSVPGVYGEVVTAPKFKRVDMTGATAIKKNWMYEDDFRITSPTTRLSLYIPFYGFVELNPLDYKDGVGYRMDIDVTTGDTVVYIVSINEPGSVKTIQTTINFNIGVQIPIAQVATQAPNGIFQFASAIAAGVGAIATGGIGGVAAGIASVALATKGAADMFYGTPSAKGSIQGRSFNYERYFFIKEEAFMTQDIDEFTLTHGRPLMEEIQLSNLSGFCQCADASVELNCMESDRDFVNNCLNSGFFIE